MFGWTSHEMAQPQAARRTRDAEVDLARVRGRGRTFRRLVFADGKRTRAELWKSPPGKVVTAAKIRLRIQSRKFDVAGELGFEPRQTESETECRPIARQRMYWAFPADLQGSEY